MSDKFQGTEKNGASPEELRDEIERLMTHVRTYNPEDCEFAIAVIGHSDGTEDENGHRDMRICSLAGGSPPVLARAITELIAELTKRDPRFALHILNNLVEDIAEARQLSLEKTLEKEFGRTGDEKTKATVTDIMSRIINNNSGSTH